MLIDEKEELRQELQEELQWVKCRQKMLDIMDEKLLQMQQLAEQAQECSLASEEREILNVRLNDLTEQVEALDSESQRTELNHDITAVSTSGAVVTSLWH